MTSILQFTTSTFMPTWTPFKHGLRLTCWENTNRHGFNRLCTAGYSLPWSLTLILISQTVSSSDPLPNCAYSVFLKLHLSMCYMNYEQSWPQFIFNVMIFGQIDTLTAALHAKKMSDELPINSLNLSGICFFLILEKEKIILTCSNWWFAAAFAPVFFRYSDQSKLRFCQFSPTSLGRKEKEEKEKENHIKPETNVMSIMRQKVLTTSYTQPTTSKSFIWQIGKKTACSMKCI